MSIRASLANNPIFRLFASSDHAFRYSPNAEYSQLVDTYEPEASHNLRPFGVECREKHAGRKGPKPKPRNGAYNYSTSDAVAAADSRRLAGRGTHRRSRSRKRRRADGPCRRTRSRPCPRQQHRCVSGVVTSREKKKIWRGTGAKTPQQVHAKKLLYQEEQGRWSQLLASNRAGAERAGGDRRGDC